MKNLCYCERVNRNKLYAPASECTIINKGNNKERHKNEKIRIGKSAGVYAG